MAKKTLTVTIEVDDGEQTITVRDDAGNEVDLGSVMILGGRESTGRLYFVGMGDHKDLAWAFGEGMSRTSADAYYAALYRAILAQMVMRTGTVPYEVKRVEVEDLEKRWEAEEIMRAMGEKDPKKWN